MATTTTLATAIAVRRRMTPTRHEQCVLGTFIIISLTMRVLVVAACLAAALALDASVLTPWTTDHHDTHNSGRSTVAYNISQYNGTCATSVSSVLEGEFFTSSGVTSVDGRRLYIGLMNSLLVFDVISKQNTKNVQVAPSGLIVVGTHGGAMRCFVSLLCPEPVLTLPVGGVEN